MRSVLYVLLLLLMIGQAALLPARTVAADAKPFTLAPIFSDHAVLQRDKPLTLWGTGPAQAKVSVALGNAVSETPIGPDGNWMLTLEAQPVAEKLTLSVYLNGTLATQRHNLALGDVWLCSGQSNMEFELHKAANGASEVANSSDAGLRLLLIPRRRSFSETSLEKTAVWAAASPASATNFSAACYYMGRDLRRRQKIPIGLIAASWGGSRIEDWLSREKLTQLGGYTDELASQDQHRRDPAASDRQTAARLELWVQKHLDDDSKARWMRAPLGEGIWENWNISDFSEFDGMARYRIKFDLPPAIAQKSKSLFIGRVDDADWTTVNGVKIGHTLGWDVDRTYPLKQGQLRAGPNEIEIVVLDTGGGGGIWGNALPSIELADGSNFALADGWEVTAVKSLDETGSPPSAPWLRGEGAATLHNGMIAALGRYAVKGYAWYQGESNAAQAADYQPLLQSMIQDWRNRFGGSPFLLVQLAGFGAQSQSPERSRWAELRDVQRRVAIGDSSVRLVPAIDIGDRFDIHPVNKKELGRRLALAASSDNWRTGIALRLTRTAGLLQIHLGKDYRLSGGVASPIGFELCNAAKICRFVSATQPRPDMIQIPVTDADHELRYLWSNSPLVSLFDADGIPLPPFSAHF